MKYSTIPIFIFCILLFVNDVQSQSKPVAYLGKTSYDRLLETQKTFNQAIIKGDSLEIAEQSYILAKRYINIGNYSKGQHLLLRSFRIRSPYGPSESLGKIYLRLSEIQIIQNHLKEAEKYARTAVYNFRKVNSIAGLTGGFRILGDIKQLFWEKNTGKDAAWALDSAHYYYKRSLKLAELLPEPIDVAITYQCLGRNAELKNDIAKSIWFKQKALEIYNQEHLVNNIIDLSTQIGLDLLRRGQAAEAKKWLDKAKSETDKPSSAHLGILVSLYDGFSFFYERTGDWKNALSYQKRAQELRLNQFEQYQSEAIQNINLVHENETKTAELIDRKKEEALQRKNMQIQKKLTAWISILLLAACIASVLFYILFVKYRKISFQNSQLVKEQNHRTKNNLQSVSDLLSLQLYKLSDPNAVIAMEESLLRVEAMTLVHRSLYMEDNLVEVNLQKYLPDLVNSVLRSYKLDFVRAEFLIADLWIHSDKAISLGLIINELTTNACKYAFKNHVRPTLTIDCIYKSGQIIFTFRDNGPGFIPASEKTGFGLGLIDMLTERLKGTSGFTFGSGSFFELSFDVNTKHNTTDSNLKNQFV